MEASVVVCPPIRSRKHVKLGTGRLAAEGARIQRHADGQLQEFHLAACVRSALPKSTGSTFNAKYSANKSKTMTICENMST